MEPNIPVGSEAGVTSGMKRAVAGAEREQREGASGKWVAHWKMVHIVRPVWERVGQDNQLGRQFPPLTYTPADANDLFLLAPAPRTVRGARDLLSVALQYGNAFLVGLQAAALKPADYFGNDDVLYLMEDMATGEIRLSILWEWLHKNAPFTADDDQVGVKAGDRFSPRRSSTSVTISSSMSDRSPCWRAIRRTRQSTLSMYSAPPTSARAAEEGWARPSAALAYFSKGTMSASVAPSPVQTFHTHS